MVSHGGGVGRGGGPVKEMTKHDMNGPTYADDKELGVGGDELLHANEVLRLAFLRHAHFDLKISAATSSETRTGH